MYTNFFVFKWFARQTVAHQIEFINARAYKALFLKICKSCTALKSTLARSGLSALKSLMPPVF